MRRAWMPCVVLALIGCGENYGKYCTQKSKCPDLRVDPVECEQELLDIEDDAARRGCTDVWRELFDCMRDTEVCETGASALTRVDVACPVPMQAYTQCLIQGVE